MRGCVDVPYPYHRNGCAKITYSSATPTPPKKLLKNPRKPCVHTHVACFFSSSLIKILCLYCSAMYNNNNNSDI